MLILVTGANGFIGSYLIQELLQLGHQVRAFVRSTSDLSSLHGLNVELCYGDVTDIESLKIACQRVDSVFHLAAVMATRKSEFELLEKINVGGTKNLIEACKAQGVRRLLHVSSVAAISAGTRQKVILNENCAFSEEIMGFANFASKRKSERLVKQAVLAGDIDAVVVNPSLVYGARDFRKPIRQGNLKIVQGKLPFYTEGGVNIVAVEDLVQGIIAAWEKGKKGERYILGGENISLKDFVEEVMAAAQVKRDLLKMPGWALKGFSFVSTVFNPNTAFSVENCESALRYHWFESTKAMRELGYKFRPASVAIKNSVKWMKERGYF